jgi:predicted phosphodiesterase
MKLLIYSDLHLEFYSKVSFYSLKIPDESEYDVVILAGDIHKNTLGLEWAAETFNKPVIYVPGNHEYYGKNFDALNRVFDKTDFGSNIHLLQNKFVDIDINGDSVRFIGSTLWTDFRLFGADAAAQCRKRAGEKMNDFRIIFDDSKIGHFTPERSVQEHNNSLSFVKRCLNSATLSDGQKIVMASHHMPHRDAVARQYKNDLLSAAFGSHVDEDIRRKINLWVFGHTHTSCDFSDNETRFICNTRGYPSERDTGFKHNKIVKI